MATRTLVAYTVALFAMIALASANAATIVSYGVQGGQPNTEFYMGTAVQPSELLDLAGTGNIVFDGFSPAALPDVDAGHLLNDGNIVLSVATSGTLPGVGFFFAGDLVEWNPTTMTASLFFDRNNFASTATNIDAVYVFDNGDILLSTTLTATLGGLTFSNADLVRYDPSNDTASLFLDGDAAFMGTQGQKDIDAAHLLDPDTLILSSLVNGGTLGDASDLVSYALPGGPVSPFLEGMGLYDGSTRNLNAVTFKPVAVPEPTTLSLLGIGLAGLGFARRKRLAA